MKVIHECSPAEFSMIQDRIRYETNAGLDSSFWGKIFHPYATEIEFVVKTNVDSLSLRGSNESSAKG